NFYVELWDVFWISSYRIDIFNFAHFSLLSLLIIKCNYWHDVHCGRLDCDSRFA
ncbi:hypothetical protein L9F63_008541, partial [Diploptera punctata]